MHVLDSLFVPGLAPSAKHPTVFKKFDELKKGESFLLINDHDPIPLYYEMKAERGEVFTWNKIENGPEVWKVEITKNEESQSAKLETETVASGNDEDVFVLNVTLLEPKMKHPTIFKHFDALQGGQGFQILNDHDPKPLYYQLIAERGNIFSWKYIQKGPVWWQVQITKNLDNAPTVGEIAAADMRKAEVFKKYGIDFCCGGKKTLKQACDEVNVEVAVVEAELDNTQNNTVSTVMDFNRWEPDFLADYIYNQHHIYYYNEGPIIADLAEKVAARHGEHFPVLFKVKDLYATLQQELKAHFIKEEKVLFPFIKALVKANRTGDFTEMNALPSITQPVQLMEADHEAAGEILAEIRSITNNFYLPEGACNSFGLLYKKLADLEADLHQHIHLENNILFPKALKLEKQLP